MLTMNLHARPSLIALSLLAWLGYVPAASALPVLDAATFASADGSVGTPVNSASPTYVNSSSGASSGVSYASGYAFSAATGAYAVASNASGLNSEGAAFASLLNTITNTSSVAQSYTLTFKIYGGSLSAASYAALDPDEYLKADYLATIKVGNDLAWFSSMSIENNGGVITSTKQGTDLNAADDGDDGVYSWNNLYVTLDLGVLNPGSSLDVVAELSDRALSNLGVYSYDCGGGYEGYGDGYGSYGGGTCTESKGQAAAFYGDPSVFAGVPIEIEATPAGADPNGLLVTARSVPEPGSLALVALAAGAAGLARRRRKPD
jgi:hypothetical protein